MSCLFYNSCNLVFYTNVESTATFLYFNYPDDFCNGINISGFIPLVKPLKLL